MKFSCENCGTRYTLPDEKVKNRILKIRCKVCEHVIVVRDSQQAASQSAPSVRSTDIEWYTSSQGGTPEGPMPLERLIERIGSGQLARGDMVWNQSMASWIRAEDALGEHFAPKTPSAEAHRPPPLLPARPVAHPPVAPPLKPRTAPKPPPPEIDPTQAMPPDFNSLFADLEFGTPVKGVAPLSPAGSDTAVALPGADTLLAPAATASALAAMEDNDTTALPELSPATDWAGLLGDSGEAPAIPDPPAPARRPAPAIEPDSAPPAPIIASAPPAPVVASAPPAPVVASAPPAAAPLSEAQSARVEDAFFSDAHPAASAAEPDLPEEREKSRLPLFIVLGVLLLGGGIALGVMISNGSGGPDAPPSTASDAAPATEDAPPSVAQASEAPDSVAPDSEAPASEGADGGAADAVAPPSEAPESVASEAPPSEAPSSVASAAPETKARPKRVAAAPKSKPDAPKSEAPATAGRFAALSGGQRQPASVPSRAAETAAPVELPETLGSSQISSVIKRYKKGLHGCYQRQLKRDASMRKASLKLAFNIERSGRTSNIKIDRKYDGTELSGCLTRLVRRWRFPEFTGAAIPVEYPLFFQASL